MHTNAKLAWILLAIIASGYGFHMSYAYITNPPSLQEMQADRNSKNKEVRDRCHLDSFSHATWETERARIESSRDWEDTCLEEYLLDDIKTNTWTSTGGIAPVAWWTFTTHVKTTVNETKDITLGIEKGVSDDTQSVQQALQNSLSPRMSQSGSLLSSLGLDSCRIVQSEDSHVTQKRGHVYATDIACDKWKSFTVSAPEWKKKYTVKAVWYEKRIGNYIILEQGVYMFVFGHTNSPHKVGDSILAWTQIGYTDVSWVSENVHLHFELWRQWYNITHDEMLWRGSRWNDEYSFRLITQRGWYTWVDDSIDFISSSEWFSPTSYEDPKDSWRWSIGYGTFAGWEGETITKSEAKKRIYTKVFQNMEFIYKNRLGLSWNERIALSSFFYNLGIGQPEIIQALKKRDMEELETLWKSYINRGTIYEKWLSKRRVKEWNKFTSR